MPKLCLGCEGDVYSLFYEISSICGCLNGRKNSCKSKEHHKIAITTVELGSKKHNSQHQKVEGFSLDLIPGVGEPYQVCVQLCVCPQPPPRELRQTPLFWLLPYRSPLLCPT